MPECGACASDCQYLGGPEASDAPRGHGCQMPPGARASDAPELGLLPFMKHLMRVMETKLWSSARPVHAFATEPSL